MKLVACELYDIYNDSIIVGVHAGLFNMRGGDVDYNPVFFSYALITTEDVRYVQYIYVDVISPIH